jgi:aryl-alcohol dehydrogenase-like predicted oxidoreductase
MGMSDGHGATDERDSIATIRAALDAGITFFNTGDFYGSGHNELLLREGLAGRRNEAIISVKFGALRDPAGRWIGFDFRPQSIKNFLTYSLRRLKTDYIDIYQPSRLDPTVPIEDTVGSIADLVRAGHVRHVGISEMPLEAVERAHAVHPIAAFEVEYSYLERGIEARTLPRLRELGIGLVPYGVFTHGLLSGRVQSRDDVTKPGDMRGHMPQFSVENLPHNVRLVEAFGQFARARGVTPAQLAVAWILRRGADLVPVLGARNPASVADLLAGASVTLSKDEWSELERLVPHSDARGERYPPEQMRMVHR